MSKVKKLINSLDEAFVHSKRVDDESIEAFSEVNQGREGQVALNLKGKEIPNSIVLSEASYAVKASDGVEVISFNEMEGKSDKIKLYLDELKYLKKFV